MLFLVTESEEIRQERGGALQPMVLTIEPEEEGCRQPGCADDCQISNDRQRRLADLRPALDDEVEDDDRHERERCLDRGNGKLKFIQKLVPGHEDAACETQPRANYLSTRLKTLGPYGFPILSLFERIGERFGSGTWPETKKPAYD